ncbi:MAG: hypothetical protein M1832_004831 [Thelocarpon impressellum]|nr:MAG: hypothetical protein M1832_004831 [Thelocarpon impressellum]
MGKKRKAPGQQNGKAGPREVDDRDARLGPISTFEDVPDSEDDFMINRDKVQLEDGPEEQRRKKWREEGMYPKRPNQAMHEVLEASDVEVLAESSDDTDSDDDNEVQEGPPPKRARQSPDSDTSEGEEEDEDFGGWGSSKRDYYNADAIETEADALAEEAEARRLQQKRLQAMTEADFAFDEDEWQDATKTGPDGEEDDGMVTEVLPELEITDSMGPEERLRILRSRYPEFEPLAEDFLSLQPHHTELSLAATAAAVVPKNVPGSPSPSIGTIKHQALTAYLGALSMYFALLTSRSTAMAASDLRDHAVMESLVKSRGLWSKVKDLRVPDASEKPGPGDLGLAVIGEESENQLTEGLVAKEAEEMTRPTKQPKSSKKKLALAAAQADAEARRTRRIQETEEDLQSLSTLTRSLKARRTAPKPAPQTTSQLKDNDSDYGEEEQLGAYEAAEKMRKKKSLRFYTSQIAQKSNRRDQAGKDAGGDADLPYRERLKDRQARVNAEAEKRGARPRQDGAADLDDSASDADENQAAHDLRANEDDYYNIVASSSRAKKVAKQAQAAFTSGANATTLANNAPLDPSGKRAIGYTIEKNKGLAPKRKKEVRNPRVKKRNKYEEKKRKLGSVRQVYRGGEGSGGYGGEATGIKSGLVRSIKL